MGHTYAKVKVFGTDLSHLEEVRLLVDTGSTYTWIDQSVLKRLGVKVRKVWKFKTIEGWLVERRIGDTVIECLGEQSPIVVVFAEDEDEEVLGVHALEGLRLEVDSSTGELKKAEASLAL